MLHRLKGIRSFVSPELLKRLAELSGGELITIGGNAFRSSGIDSDKIVRLDGIPIPVLLKEVMKLIPVTA